jgi:succinoglycan biosynthesis transport protein ExoP
MLRDRSSLIDQPSIGRKRTDIAGIDQHPTAEYSFQACTVVGEGSQKQRSLMEAQQYLAVVKKWWWLLLACVVVCALSSYLIVSRLPRIYEATTTLRVGQALESPNPGYQDFYISQQLAQTYATMASRQPILRGAADALGLPSVPREKDVSAQIVPNTQFLEVSVRDRDPERARALANAIAQQLILQSPEGLAEDQMQRAFVQTQLQDLQEDIQATREKMKAEQAKLGSAGTTQSIQQSEDNLAALQDKLASYRSTYAALLQIANHRTNELSVFQPATTPSRPVRPWVSEIVALVTAFGLFLVLGVAYLVESLNDTLKTTDELAYLTKLPILGIVDRMKKEDGESLVAALQPRSSIAEAYRTLRTNIQFSSVDRPVQTMAVTSPGLFEGKTTTAANLGVVMAQAGKSVVLVDADLRRPSLHQVFDLPNENGLTRVLAEAEPMLDGRLQETGIDHLRVLTSGPLPPNPSELLGSHKMDRLIGWLKEEAELVIFDTAPVLPVTDAAVLASQTDGVLLIVVARQTKRAAVLQATENLRQVGANVMGTVLNKFSPRRAVNYYDYEEQPEQ